MPSVTAPQLAHLELLPQLLGGVLQTYAPQAELMVDLDGVMLHITAAQVTRSKEGALEPELSWLEGGQLDWINHEGQLVGLLWSPEEIAADVRNSLELMVSGAVARHEAASDPEFLRLLSQFPLPAIWLDHSQHVLAASRSFLEQFELSEDIFGRPLADVLPLPQLTAWLDEANRRSVHHQFDWFWQPSLRELMPAAEVPLLESLSIMRAVEQTRNELWLRARTQPFYTSAQSGTLLTLQDVSAEYQQRAWTRILLAGLSQPTAVVTVDGRLLQANEALLELGEVSAEQAQALLRNGAVGAERSVSRQTQLGGFHSGEAGGLADVQGMGVGEGQVVQLAALPALSGKARSEIAGLLALAKDTGAALGPVALGGEMYQLELRRSQLNQGLLVAQFNETERGDGPPPLQSREMLQGILNRQHTATLLVDGSGRLQLLNEAASRLLGVDAAKLLGRNALRQLQRLGIRMLDTQGEPLPVWKLPLPYAGEAQLEIGELGRRPIELGLHGLNAKGQAALHQDGSPEYLMVTLHDLSELKRAQAQASYGASHDNLTGLLNRAGLREHLREAEGTGTVAALQLRDYSELSSVVKATAMHHLLLQLAAGLRNLSAVYQGGAARLGESLFAVWLPGLAPAEAAEALEPVLQATYRLGQEKAALNFAVGLAEVAAPEGDEVGPEGIEGAEAALGNAETAAQVSRRDDREQVVVYRRELRERLASSFRLEQSLRDAVTGGSLGLHFQPLVALRDLQGVPAGAVAEAEALLRWDGTMTLSPYELLEVAARIRVLRPLSNWVLHEAAAQQRAWNAEWHNLKVSVNLSLEELRQPDALDVLWPVLDEMEQAGLPRPSIELNAASTLHCLPQDLKVLERLSSLGVELWLDNFGEGPLSLLALTQLPLAGIKLHPALIETLSEGTKQADLVLASTDIARRLGVRMAAVGVETPEQLQLVTKLGCDLAQGYAISRPLSAPELERWMRAR